jgi:putative ATPase
VSLDAKEAFDFLGSPEGELALVEAAVYCALAPKSNAVYRAEGEARRDVAERPAEPVPLVIRNAVTRLMKDVGYGRGYRYAHDEPEGVGGIECLPDRLRGTRYYRPAGVGEEAELAKRLEEVIEKRRKKSADS